MTNPVPPFRRALGALAAACALSASALAAQTYVSPYSSLPALGAFGGAVAVGNGELFIGEPRNSMRSGMVYVYRKGASGWAEATQLKAADAEYSDGFGSGLAVDGRTLVVGASAQGAIYVFQKDAAGAWKQAAKLTAGDPAASEGFGTSLAVKGDVLLAGAAGGPVGGFGGFGGRGGAAAERPAGTVYVFRRDASGTWAAAGSMKSPDSTSGDLFGAALAFDGLRAAIGAPGMSERAGQVYLYEVQNGNWNATGSITTPENRPFGRRGGGQGRGGPAPAPATPPTGSFGASVRLENDHSVRGRADVRRVHRRGLLLQLGRAGQRLDAGRPAAALRGQPAAAVRQRRRFF